MRTTAALVLILAVVFAGCISDDLQLDDGEPDSGAQPERAEKPEGPSVESGPAVDPPEVDGDFTVSFVDVGQGDAIVLQWQQYTVVYDTGDRFEASHGALVDHLKRLGTTTVDALVISHPHADHAGGCPAVIENFQVMTFIHPGVAYPTQTWQRCLDAVGVHNIPTFTGHDLEIGGDLGLFEQVVFQVLHVDPYEEDVHDANLALRLVYGQFAVILTGDLECKKESVVLQHGLDLSADVLSLGHHGSRTSTCSPWLDAISPSIAVAGVGADNPYGHPHQEVVDRLERRGVELYRTDHHGTITITTDGMDWHLVTERDASVGQEGPTPDSLIVTATVENDEPCQYTEVQVHISVTQEDGTAVAGADVVSTWHYATTSPSEQSQTGPGGTTTHERYIGGASPGHTVVVGVEAQNEQGHGTTSTEFTPQEC